jgi:hypothetical protein
MQILFSFLPSFVTPLLFWSQVMPAAPAPMVDPPRQEMQSVIPNLVVGPYLLNVTGKTFQSDVFLDVQVTDNGHSVPDGTTVTFAAAPTTTGDSAPDGGTPVDLTAVTTGGHAKFVPDLAASEDWLIMLSVTGPAGDGVTTPQKVGIDPHRPQDSQAYGISLVAIPIVTVLLLLGLFRLRGIDLEQRPVGRIHARENGAREQRQPVG